MHSWPNSCTSQTQPVVLGKNAALLLSTDRSAVITIELYESEVDTQTWHTNFTRWFFDIYLICKYK